MCLTFSRSTFDIYIYIYGYLFAWVCVGKENGLLVVKAYGWWWGLVINKDSDVHMVFLANPTTKEKNPKF